MNKQVLSLTAAFIAALFAVAGCSQGNSETTSPTGDANSTVAAAAVAHCDQCGVITGVKKVEIDGNTTGAGAAIGAVAGAVVGHQFGGGRGKTATTIAGAAGGAAAGNAVEDSVNDKYIFKVSAKLNDGQQVSVNYKNKPPFTKGQHVKLVDGHFAAR
jgi:outer membrane lipoprotein SlyB